MSVTQTQTIERVAVAAVLYVADPECAMALAELEDAVADLAVHPPEPGTALANVLGIVGRLPKPAPELFKPFSRLRTPLT